MIVFSREKTGAIKRRVEDPPTQGSTPPNGDDPIHPDQHGDVPPNNDDEMLSGDEPEDPLDDDNQPDYNTGPDPDHDDNQAACTSPAARRSPAELRTVAS